jgi:uncharacterized protein YndB with AHSA1/START domain
MISMETTIKTNITVESVIQAPVDTVWGAFTDPGAITQWCNASDDWHAPYAENDVRTGGRFKTTMAAKDKSMQFDFSGVYTNVQPEKLLAYKMDDGRKVTVIFTPIENSTRVAETFEAEESNPVEMQKAGWQAILDNFKKYVESL